MSSGSRIETHDDYDNVGLSYRGHENAFSPNANSFSNSCLSIPPIVTTTIAIENYVHHCTISFEDGEDDDGTRDNELKRPQHIQRPTPRAEEVEVCSRNPSATHLLLEAYAPS